MENNEVTTGAASSVTASKRLSMMTIILACSVCVLAGIICTLLVVRHIDAKNREIAFKQAKAEEQRKIEETRVAAAKAKAEWEAAEKRRIEAERIAAEQRAAEERRMEEERVAAAAKAAEERRIVEAQAAEEQRRMAEAQAAAEQQAAARQRADAEKSERESAKLLAAEKMIMHAYYKKADLWLQASVGLIASFMVGANANPNDPQCQAWAKQMKDAIAAFHQAHPDEQCYEKDYKSMVEKYQQVRAGIVAIIQGVAATGDRTAINQAKAIAIMIDTMESQIPFELKKIDDELKEQLESLRW